MHVSPAWAYTGGSKTERGTSMEIAGMGWLPDYPDFRDYSAEKGG